MVMRVRETFVTKELDAVLTRKKREMPPRRRAPALPRRTNLAKRTRRNN
jgi:hypothetical protein